MTAEARNESSGEGGYLPALRFRALTPLFDAVVRTSSRERTFKRALLDQADLAPGQRVLDLGCGTGTLSILAKRREPGCELVGLDADPEILVLARRKAAAAELDLRFVQGFSTDLPCDDDSIDRVLSTLFFHHLPSADKQRTLAEIARVLKPSGRLHVADYASPADPLQRALSWQVRLFDGVERTRENFTGRLPGLIRDAGLTDVEERGRLRTAFGTLGLWSARR